MLPGYNHNVEYQARTFHVQTEDSGIDNPHIISHLFEGGNILETRKCDYTNILDSEQRDKVLMSLMLNQHQALIRELESGQLDHVLDGSSRASEQEEPEPMQQIEEPTAERSVEDVEPAESEPTPPEVSQDAAPEQTEPQEPSWLAKLGTPRIIHRRSGLKNDKAKTDADALPSEKAGLAGRPEAENLVGIYAALAGREVDAVLKEFGGRGFAEFKPALADLAVAQLSPLGQKMRQLMENPADIDTILADGATRAAAIARPLMAEVRDIVGFLGTSTDH